MAAILFFLAVAIGVAIHLARTAARLLSVRGEAAEAWQAHLEEGGREVEGLDEAAFRRAYVRAYAPVGAIHAYIGVAAAALLTAPAFIILDVLWSVGWRLADEPRPYAPGFLIWQFYIYFGIIATWVAVVAAVMQRYHRNRPRALRHELARERERAARGVAPQH